MHYRFFFILVLLLASSNQGAAEQTTETALCRVTANGYEAGEFFFDIAGDDEVLVTSDFLTKLRLKKELWAAFSPEQISLVQLSPRLSYTIDRTDAALVLDIDPQWFETQAIGRRNREPKQEPHNSIPGQPLAAFLNYSLNASYQDDQGINNFNIPLETGVNYHNWHFFSTFNASCNDNDCEASRLNTRITGNAPDQLRFWTIGDITPHTLRLQSSRAMGGIALASNFTLDPAFKPYPTARLDTIIETPVTAELIRNGQIVEEWDLLPGPVTLYDLVGIGDDSLVLRDAFGREQYLDLPTLLGGQTLLRKGVHEFSYNLGLLRDNFAQDNENYSGLAATGLHRYGINDWFTTGVAFSLQANRFDLGTALGLQLGNHNWLDLETLYRKNHGNQDYGVSVSHSLNIHPFSLFLSFQYTGENFFVEEFAEVEERDAGRGSHRRSVLQATTRFSSHILGGLSIGLSRHDYWEADAQPSTAVNLSYSRSISQFFSLSAGMRHQLEGADAEDSFFFSLTFIPGNNRANADIDSANYHYAASDNNEYSHKLSLQKSAGMATGTGYSLEADQQDDGTSLGGRYMSRNNSAVITASLDQSAAGAVRGTAGVSGSIVRLDNGLYFGRPVIDGFAVVTLDPVDGLDDVPIQHNNALVGRLAPGSSLVVPGVLSHQENEISLHSGELPIDFISMDDKKYVQIENKGGASVRFAAAKFTAVEGNLYLETADGKETELSSLPLELMVNKEKRTGFIGLSGYFYLENLPLGEYVLRILRFEGDCEARFSVTASEDIVTNIGRLACRPLAGEK